MTLSFTDFELEMINWNCSHDAVDVLDGDNYQAPSIGSPPVSAVYQGSVCRYAASPPRHSMS